MKKPLIIAALSFAFVAGGNAAFAQEKVDGKKVEELKTEGSLPPPTGHSASAKAGTEEPSTRRDTAKQENVFVNGVLSVPGAATEVDTAPSKFSPRSAAADRLPIAGYRFRRLTGDQRREILQALSAQHDAPVSSPAGGEFAVIGAEVPATVAQQSLAPVPEELAAKFPELRGTAFMRSGGGIIVVDRDNRLVIGLLGT